MSHNILKIFCSGPEQDAIVSKVSGTVMERYPGFILVDVPADQVAALASAHVVEDITTQYAIRAGDEVVDTSVPRMDNRGALMRHPAYKDTDRVAPGPHHYIVQFIGPIKEAWLQEVADAGGVLRGAYEGFSYIVRADEDTLPKIVALPCVRWTGHLSHRHRIAPSLLTAEAPSLRRSRFLPDVYSLEFFDKGDMDAAAPGLAALGFEETHRDGDIMVVRDNGDASDIAERVRGVAAVHGVRFVRKRGLKRLSNDVAARHMGTSFSMAPAGLQLSGAGEIIAVCDTGLDTGDKDTVHPDFRGRIKWIESYPLSPDVASYVTNPGGDDGPADLDSGHGTHVAGSVLGNGASSLDITNTGGAGLEQPIRGLAYNAQLVFQAIEQEQKWKDPQNYQRYGRYGLTGIPSDLGTLFTAAYAQGARIHSDSWGGGDPGAYDEQCRQLDRFVWNQPDFCILVAAGNDGSDSDGNGRINPMSVTSPGTAKNCITVGASENLRRNFNHATYGGWWPSDYPAAPYRTAPMADDPEHIAAFSSRGPTSDGRIKPEVVAPGTFILSTRSSMIAENNHGWAKFPSSKRYFYMGGTSMATPLTAGGMALIREHLRTAHGMTSPSAALLKAIVCAGARRLPNHDQGDSIFDHDQGFGRVDLDTSLAPSAPAAVVFADVKPGLRTGEMHTVDIAVASDQVPLRVVLAYSDYPGATLVNNLNMMLVDPVGQRWVGNQPTSGILTLDAKNNMEAVHVARPMAGVWRLEIVAANVPHGPQPFALVYQGHIGQADGDDNRALRVETSPRLDIPDMDPRGVSSTLTVEQAEAIGTIEVEVDISHTYIGDLRVSLSAPNGATIVLHERQGASARDIIRVYNAQNTPALAALQGTSTRGEWRLLISDHAAQDKGQLRRWALRFTTAPNQMISRVSAPGLAIPDNDSEGVHDTIELAGSGRVRTIQVRVDITHTWIGDLEVSLSAPSGETVILHDKTGDSRDNLIERYDLNNQTALRKLVGQDIQGNWTLRVRDMSGRDVGKLNRWGLDIEQ